MVTLSDGPARARLASRFLAAFLFLTGASALIYQVVWTRYLGLLLGSSSVAVVVVLAAFMGGLALGSWLLGRVADRPIRRLTLYAWLELGVGLYCVLFPTFLSAASGLYLKLVASFSSTHPVAFLAARLVFAASLLLPPTVLMGGTLPAATRFLVELAPGVRSAVGRLYWVNSAGAVVGALLAGFVFIPRLGLDLSLDLAALVNILVGVGALALRSRMGWGDSGETVLDPAEAPLPGRAVAAALAAVTLSGFAALAVEVAWTRLLALVLGGSTYSFTVMVATFILGIAIGSRLVVAHRFGQGDPVVWLAGALALVAATVAASLPLYPRLPWLFQGLAALLSRTPSAFPLYQAMLLAMAMLVMLVPTIAMGATLPLAARISTHAMAVGSRVGLTWALNTTGTLLGAILAGLVLLPRIGLQATFGLVVTCYAVAAFVALTGAARTSRRAALAVGITALAALVALTVQPGWPLLNLARGVYRTRVSPGSYQEWLPMFGGGKLLWTRDGATATVAVLETDQDRMLRVNGKTDASLRSDLETQLLLGHLPALLAPEGGTRALVIGLGSGATVAALAAHQGLEITAVEIEPAVVEAARSWFTEVNEGVLEGHPRVRVLVEDAKTVFQRGGPPWDIIVSEPSNPWLAGVGGLFSREFFEAARARLAPNGVMAQWLQSYEMDDDTVRLVLRTFREVFPEVTVWQSLTNDFILIGASAPLSPDPASLTRRFQVSSVRRSLAKASVDSVEGLLARQALSPQGVAAAAGRGPVNTDQFPTLEFDAPRGLFTGEVSRIIPDLDERPFAFGRKDLLLHHWLSRGADAAALQSIARSVTKTLPGLAEALLAQAATMSPPSPDSAVALAAALETRGELLRARSVLDTAPRSPAGDALLAKLEFAVAAQACNSLRNGLTRPPDCSRAVRLGEALHRAGGSAAELRALDESLARVYLWSGASIQALEHFRALLAQPGTTEAARRAEWLTGEAAALLALGDKAGAGAAAEAALRADPQAKAARRIRAAAGP